MVNFFQTSWHSLAYQFTISAPLMCPPPFPFSIFRGKKFAFLVFLLAKISAFKMQIFQIFIPKTSHFSRRIFHLDPPFGNLCSKHPPKKVECPPPPGGHNQTFQKPSFIAHCWQSMFLKGCCKRFSKLAKGWELTFFTKKAGSL